MNSELQQIISDYNILHTRMLKLIEEMQLRGEARTKNTSGWAYFHDKCSSCGTTSKEGRNKHWGNGLCLGCYNKIAIKVWRKKQKLKKLQQPPVQAPVVPVAPPKAEKPPTVSKKKLGQYIPINCYKCGIVFEANEPRVESEDDSGERQDYHQKCWEHLFD